MARSTPSTSDTLSSRQMADLRVLATNPDHALPAMRRRTFLRLRLISPCASQPTPSDKRRARPPKRRYELTELGREVASR